MTPEQIEKEFFDSVVALCENTNISTDPYVFTHRVMFAHGRMKQKQFMIQNAEFQKRFPMPKKEATK